MGEGNGRVPGVEARAGKFPGPSLIPPLTVIQRHLGHESIQTSSDRYGHLDRKSSRVVADVVGNALKPRKAASKQKNAASL